MDGRQEVERMAKKLDKMVTKKKTVGSSELAQLQQEPEVLGPSICAIHRPISRGQSNRVTWSQVALSRSSLWRKVFKACLFLYSLSRPINKRPK